MLLFHQLHSAVEVPKKTLHRLLSGLGSVFQPLGDRDLVLEMQLVAFAPADVMQMVANRPDEPKGIPQLLELGVGDQSEVLKVAGLAQVGLQPRHPEHGVVIAQPTLAFLQVGLKQISGIAELGMPAAGVSRELLQYAVRMLANDLVPDLGHQVGVQHRHAADESGIHDRRQHI